jgi:hypothetical protein
VEEVSSHTYMHGIPADFGKYAHIASQSMSMISAISDVEKPEKVHSNFDDFIGTGLHAEMKS